MGASFLFYIVYSRFKMISFSTLPFTDMILGQLPVKILLAFL